MIIPRQKEYSTKRMQFVRALNSVKDKVITAVNNAGLKAGNTIKEVATGKPTPFYMKTGFNPKTPYQINRETVQQVRGAQKAIKDTAKEIYYTPGQILDKGIKYTVENPISATGNAASVILPAVNPVFLTVPVGGPSIALNALGKNKVGFYKKGTQRLGKAYEGSRFSHGLRSLGNLPETTTQVGQMIPH